jgi:DNA-binding beta-propeller fold protein YncE
MHILPDLVRLENKYGNALVVIGVHSPKFPHEKKTANIRKAILRYGVDHPVVNDANLVLWNRYRVGFWPTFVVIGPDGREYGSDHGEGLFKELDTVIGKLVRAARARKLLKTTPLHFALERAKIKGPLFFPGKVLADAVADRLFISDSSNNRIVITDLAGKKVAVAGTGKEGKHDGPFASASFADPQGLAFDGVHTLYVADRKNHLIRALDLKAQTVKTIAGTGVQDRRPVILKYVAHPALRVGLNSPWGLALSGNLLYVGMSGDHQVWVMDLKRKLIGPLAGNGMEEIRDGALRLSCFAQPSGLALNGETLFVADSESSAIRAILLGNGVVKTVVGMGLMVFGDANGQGRQVRLQHALDVAFAKGKLYVADTYNSKIKLIDPATQTCETFLGDKEGTFDEPGGLSIAAGKLYVADTSAHRIRVIDLATRDVSTLELQDVEPGRQEKSVSKAS